MDIQSLPNHLQSIANNVLAHIHEGSSAPENIDELIAWFEDDGWDEIVGAWSDERVVLKLYEIATRFDDREFRAWEDVKREITDEERVGFARRQIDYVLDVMYESFCPSVHSVELNDNGGKTAVLGWLVEISVGGASPDFCGVYADRDQFHQAIRENGHLFHDEIESLSDDQILKLWQR